MMVIILRFNLMTTSLKGWFCWIQLAVLVNNCISYKTSSGLAMLALPVVMYCHNALLLSF